MPGRSRRYRGHPRAGSGFGHNPRDFDRSTEAQRHPEEERDVDMYGDTRRKTEADRDVHRERDRGSDRLVAIREAEARKRDEEKREEIRKKQEERIKASIPQMQRQYPFRPPAGDGPIRGPHPINLCNGLTPLASQYIPPSSYYQQPAAGLLKTNYPAASQDDSTSTAVPSGRSSSHANLARDQLISQREKYEEIVADKNDHISKARDFYRERKRSLKEDYKDTKLMRDHLKARLDPLRVIPGTPPVTFSKPTDIVDNKDQSDWLKTWDGLYGSQAVGDEALEPATSEIAKLERALQAAKKDSVEQRAIVDIHRRKLKMIGEQFEGLQQNNWVFPSHIQTFIRAHTDPDAPLPVIRGSGSDTPDAIISSASSSASEDYVHHSDRQSSDRLFVPTATTANREPLGTRGSATGAEDKRKDKENGRVGQRISSLPSAPNSGRSRAPASRFSTHDQRNYSAPHSRRNERDMDVDMDERF